MQVDVAEVLERDGSCAELSAPGEWWRTAVVYQVYLRSFADGNGDGVGDIAGLRSRLPYLVQLGVDALWLNPWYPSPMVDAGYDVANYRDIEPAYGTLAEAESFITAARELGLRVILDIVPNHTSSRHHWFQDALTGDADARARYIFRPGKGTGGNDPPNDWRSNFGGPAWTRTFDESGRPGDWYLHLFTPEQPDLDWTNPEVSGEFEGVLRFWFDRGVDGFRIDVAHGLAKAPGLPDAKSASKTSGQHPAWDQDGVHEIYSAWRKVADSYDPPRVFVAEAWVSSNERLARYLRADELHLGFQFDLVSTGFDASAFRSVIDNALNAVEGVGAASTWVLANHDVVREVTRYARHQPKTPHDVAAQRLGWSDEQPDLARGHRRARAAALLMLALPGAAFLYQGEELGLPEVEALPDDARQDPIWTLSTQTDPGRDGCRVPMPWSGDQPPFGFSPDDATRAPWLPQPREWAPIAAERQSDDDHSMLSLYRRALEARREHITGVSAFSWLDSPVGSLAFRRGRVQCWVNSGPADIPLRDGRVLLASGPGPDSRVLPTDTAVWLADE